MRFPRVLSFGRTGDELLDMFALSPSIVSGRRVLDCPGGPGSLSSLLRRLGARPTAVDPTYQLPWEELEALTQRDLNAVAEQICGDEIFREHFDHATFMALKHQALKEFMEDRSAHPGDYVAAALPQLPFADQSFDLVLSGSLLFSYSPAADGGLLEGEGLDLAWHRQALQELMRVAVHEVRLYPAHTQYGAEAVVHPYIPPLLEAIPSGWEAALFPSRLDQGIKGETVGLRLQRSACKPKHPGRRAPDQPVAGPGAFF